MHTFFFVPLDLLLCILNFYPVIFEVFDTLSEIFPVSGKFKHQNPFFSGKNGCVEYVEGQIIIFYQSADQGFMHDLFGKTKNKYFGIHNIASAMNC